MRQRLRVLVLGQRIDRSELLAALGQALQAGAQLLPALVLERLLGGRRLQLELSRQCAQRLLGVRLLVASSLRAHLRRRQRLAGGMQARLDRRLLLRACAQLCGHMLPGLAIAGQLGVECEPCAQRSRAASSCSPPGSRRSPAQAPRHARSRPEAGGSASPAPLARARRARSAPAPRSARPVAARADPRPGLHPEPCAGAAIAAARRRCSSTASSKPSTAARCAAIACSRSLSSFATRPQRPRRRRAPPAQPARPTRLPRSARRGGCARPVRAPRRPSPSAAARR